MSDEPDTGRVPLPVYTGCRTTTARHARGRGIGAYLCRGDDGWTRLGEHPASHNPSYLILSPTGHRLYAVHGGGSTVSVYEILPDGRLGRRIGERDCGGSNPVHLVISQGGRWLLIANYASGNVACLPIDSDGDLGNVAFSLPLKGTRGPFTAEQQGAHPHQITHHPAGHWVAVPDKGTDAVHIIRLDEASGRLACLRSHPMPPGSGPRHLVFSRDGLRAWIALELSSQVLAVQVDPVSGGFTPTHCLSTLPADAIDENTAAGIALSASEDTLYVSNRGHGSVVQYAVTGGQLTPRAWHRTAGKVPRFITLAPHQDALWVANEDADVIERLSPGSAPTVLAHAGSPVCIAFHSGVPR